MIMLANVLLIALVLLIVVFWFSPFEVSVEEEEEETLFL